MFDGREVQAIAEKRGEGRTDRATTGLRVDEIGHDLSARWARARALPPGGCAPERPDRNAALPDGRSHSTSRAAARALQQLRYELPRVDPHGALLAHRTPMPLSEEPAVAP